MTKDRRDKSAKFLPEHESGVRRLIADAIGGEYRALPSLADAKAYEDGVVVLEGDYGGQIYVVARATGVCCSEDTLADLLLAIDNREWNDPDGARVYYERHTTGSSLAGGMGGGVVTDKVWVHPRLDSLESAIVEVLAGRRPRLEEVDG